MLNLRVVDFTAVTAIRPVMIWVAFKTLVRKSYSRPLQVYAATNTLKLKTVRESNPESTLSTLLKLRQPTFIIHRPLLLALVLEGLC